MAKKTQEKQTDQVVNDLKKTDKSRRTADEPKKKNDTAGKQTRTDGAKKADGAETKQGRKKQEAKEVEKLLPPSSKTIHQFLPWVWLVLCVYAAVDMILLGVVERNDALGPVGYFIHKLFYGTFGYGAAALPFICLNLAVFWRQYVDRKLTYFKLILSVVTLSVLSAWIHVLAHHNGTLKTDFSQMVIEGSRMDGGGIVGGYFGWACFEGLHLTGSMIILTGLLIALALLLIGVTPVQVWTEIRRWIHNRKEKIKRRREERQAEELAYEEPAVIEPAPVREKLKAPRKKAELPPAVEPAAAELDPDGDVLTPDPLLTEKKEEEPVALPAPEPMPMPAPAPAPEPEPEPMLDPAVVVFPSGKKNKKTDFVELDLSGAASEAELVDEEDAEDETDEVLQDLPDAEDNPYVFPPVDLLKPTDSRSKMDEETMRANQHRLEETLKSFHIPIKEVTYSCGPTVTRYEIKPEAGVRVRQIANLSEDIAMGLAATSGIRIEAPIPGKDAVGIEVPNAEASMVGLRNLLDSPKFTDAKSKINVCLGEDIVGAPVYMDIAKMPHLLIAGTTGSGKSVCINSILMSIMYHATPHDVKLILIDPKKVEFTVYRDLPHLYVPVVNDTKKAAGALCSAVTEMERRYSLIEEAGVRDIAAYNAGIAQDPDREYLPQIVIIIDELAELMMTTRDLVEAPIVRIAQKARAAGIHLIVGTQRPSVDVVTGLIKANIPSRIAFTVATQTDSRTILDMMGAEKLMGRGDMLYSPIGTFKPKRVQGAFVSDDEVEAVVKFVKENNEGAQYNEEFTKQIEIEAAKADKKATGGPAELDDEGAGSSENGDNKFVEAVQLAVDTGKISTSLLQRKLGLGYGRAAKIIDEMEDKGYVGASDGQKPRKILITQDEFLEKRMNGTL